MKKRSARTPVVPVPGFQLIEASAGTGKTYSITNQYLHLLLEAGLRVDQVLVVTYTEAATAELRDRIRSRIRDIHDAVLAGDVSTVDDGPLRDHLLALLADDSAKERALRRLSSAIVCFDQAAIYTIHGFCNRILAEQAFAAGMEFQMEVVADDTALLESVVADFVRVELGGLTESKYLAFVEHSPLVDGVGKGEWNVPGRLLLKEGLDALSAILNNPFTRILPEIRKEPRLEEGPEEYALWMTRRLIEYVREQLPKKKRDAGIISYGDMLLGVWQALESDRKGRLAAELRATYKAALIDEFQDTNPLQYEIFRKIFRGTDAPVVFVGDPKQAIFAFNGGDIFAYFDATGAIPQEQRSTLEVNYRSASPLVEAITNLFTSVRTTDVFIDENRCAFPPVKAHTAGGKDPKELPPGKGAMHWFLMPGSDLRNKPDARAMAVEATVREIAELLHHAAATPAVPARLQPGDIAVLVRTHADGAKVQDALRNEGIPSVVKSRGDVFESQEAEELLLVLRAIADPRNESALSAALLTPFLGFTGPGLAHVREEAGVFEAIVSRFVELQKLWAGSSFIRMAMELLHVRGMAADGGSVIEQIGRAEGSERALTNLLHLFEILHQENLLHPGVRHLVNWMERRMADAGERDAPIRLESDEARVQIVTVHSSKGLEYPVVFCPFVWEAKGYTNYTKSVVFCHDPGSTEGRTALLADLGSKDRMIHVEQARKERISENIRLLYVALTRARQRLYLVWGKVNKMHDSALPWLIFPGFDGQSSFFKEKSYEEIVRPVVDLQRRSSGGVTFSVIDDTTPVRSVPAPGAAAELRARVFAGTPPVPGWGFASYTSLTRQWSRSSADRDTAAEEIALPREIDPGILSFPSGARTGIVWHELFERLDFRAGEEEIRAIAAMIPGKAGAPASFAPAVEAMIRAALARPITPDGGRLCDLTETVRELEFTFTVPRFRTDEVRRVLQDPSHHLPPEFRDAAAKLAHKEVSGFMTGAIDLLFRWNGKFYLADYKSNTLGTTLADYSAKRLREAMAREHYYLQYLIYTVAVNRYLANRVAGYSYDKQFGGAVYLFLRGVDGGEGVFFDRPAQGLIEALDRLGERT